MEVPPSLSSFPLPFRYTSEKNARLVEANRCSGSVISVDDRFSNSVSLRRSVNVAGALPRIAIHSIALSMVSADARLSRMAHVTTAQVL